MSNLHVLRHQGHDERYRAVDRGRHLARAFDQNLRRGHYGLALEEPAIRRLAVAFDELAVVI